MLDFFDTPVDTGKSDIQIFTGNSPLYGECWQKWVKPRGKSMCSILLIGKGGNGGTSTPGAATAVAGSGGGSSGTLVYLLMPTAILPDILYLTLAGITTNALVNSCISIAPDTTANNIIAFGRGGTAGGNATSATAGTAGTASAIPTVSEMPLGWQYTLTALAGQAGSVGGGAQSAGANITIPTTGLIVTGGTGGGGIDSAAGTPGYAGGSFTITAGADFPAQPGGIAGAAASTPPGPGANGYKLPGKLFFYGGTGSGSSYNAATGAGLVQLPGGNGGYGCGGGGVGAAQTGSVAAPAGMGGPAFAMITCW